MKDIKLIYSLLLNSNGLKIREIAQKLDLEKSYVANILFSDKCISYWYQNDAFLWFAKEGAIEINAQIHYSLPKNVATKKKYKKKDRELINNPIESSYYYLKCFIKNNSFSKIETKNLFERYRRGDKTAYDLLLKSHLRLIPGIAKSYKDKGVPLEDLLQEGVLGLIKSIELYTVNGRKSDFRPYAAFYIYQYISSAINNYSNIVRIPVNQLAIQSRIDHIIEKHKNEFGYKPGLDYVVSCFDNNINIEDNYLLYLYYLCTDNTDNLVKYDSLHDLEDDYNRIDEWIEKEHCEKKARMILSRLKYLNKRNSTILAMYFGIGYKKEMTLEEIGKEFDLTRERVRQIKEKALRDLRTIVKDKKSSHDSVVKDKKGNLINKNKFKSDKNHKSNLLPQNNADNSVEYHLLRTVLNDSFIESGVDLPIKSSTLIQSITGCNVAEIKTFNVKVQVDNSIYYTQMKHLCFIDSSKNFFRLDWRIQSHIQALFRELKKKYNYTVINIYLSIKNKSYIFIINPGPKRGCIKHDSDKKADVAKTSSLLRVVDYSPKAIAVYGDTKPFADVFKLHGGTFNPRLHDGAGWVFSKRREAEIRTIVDELNNKCPSKQYKIGFDFKNKKGESSFKNELSNEKIKLLFNDGKVETLAPFDALKRVILLVGIQKVRVLDIRIKSHPILQRIKTKGIRYEGITMGWWLNGELKTKHCINCINIILNHYNVGVKAEFLEFV